MRVPGPKARIPVTGGTLQPNRGRRRQPSTHDRIGHLEMTRPALLNRLERYIGDNHIVEVLGYSGFATRRYVQSTAEAEVWSSRSFQ